MNFAELKKKSKTNLVNLVAELEKTSSTSRFQDDRFWSVPMDEKTGNGMALIRFLPAGKDDNLPWVSLFSHAFQGPGGWYIENSLSTIGKNDPCGEVNSELWSTGIDANKEVARKRKRKQQYISNIFVITDSKNPKNEGKVMLFKYGKKIFEKIQEAMKPVFADKEAIDPFDFWLGADFRLRVKKVEGYPNYDSSTFEHQSPFLDGKDAALEKVWTGLFPLNEFTDVKNFKSYDELKARLDRVLGNKSSNNTQASSGPSRPAPESKQKAASKAASKASSTEDVPWGQKSESDSEGEDESLDYFERLANE